MIQNVKTGKMMFSSKGELYYHLLLEMGLGLDKANHVYDQTSGDTLAWREKYIKCSVDDQPIYAGKDEVIFSIDENFQLFMSIYAHFLNNIAEGEDYNFRVTAHYVDFNEEIEKSILTIKIEYKDPSFGTKVITTDAYSDAWLCYIESIFLLNDNPGFDLHNFDQIREKR